MTPEPPTPTPRRTRRFFLWLGVLLLVFSAWRGWKEYDYRAAVKEAKALGWYIENSSPFDDIKKDWHAAIRLKTWRDPRRGLAIKHTDVLTGHESLILRLNPQGIEISHCPTPRDFSFLKHLPDLRYLSITNLLEMTDANMDQIEELTELKNLHLYNCPRLTHLNPFIKLVKLKGLTLLEAPLIPKKDIEAFKAAHPNTNVFTNP